MYKTLLLIVSTLILTACHGWGNGRHTHGDEVRHVHGDNMRDGNPERAIHQHSYNVMRNEAGTASAVGQEAKARGWK